MEITLMRVPGNGMEDITIAPDATVADVVHEHGLLGRNIFVDGIAVAPENYGSTSLAGASEIFATGTVKGA